MKAVSTLATLNSEKKVVHTITCPHCKTKQQFRFNCSIDPCVIWECENFQCRKVLRVVFSPIYCMSCRDVRRKFCGPLRVISEHDGPWVKER